MPPSRVLRRPLRRPVLTAVAVLALSAAVPVVPVVPAVPVAAVAGVARAADASGPVDVEGHSSSQCVAGRFCLWSGAGFSGAFWSTGASGVSESAVTVARSVWNRTSQGVRVHAGPGGTGAFGCWVAGAQSASTSTPSVSVRTMGGTTC